MLRRSSAGRADRPVADAAQGERDQQRDDQRVEDHRREDRRFRRAERHHVEGVERALAAGREGVGGREHRRQDREVLGDVVGDREGGQGAAGDQQLLADLDDLDQLRRIGVEVDHVARLARRLGAGVHRDADVGLGQGGGVVGAVAGHRDQAPVGLLLADQLQLSLRRRFGEEVVDARLLGDLRRGQLVVAGDHDRADAHRPQLVEAGLHPFLDHVLEVDHAQDPLVARHRQRGPPLAADPVELRPQLRRRAAALLAHPGLDRVAGALAQPGAVEVDAAHPGLAR